MENVTIYDTKRTVSTTQSTTRLTNANEQMRVDRKLWSSAYTSASLAEVDSVPSTNGIPRTDPEVTETTPVAMETSNQGQPVCPHYFTLINLVLITLIRSSNPIDKTEQGEAI